MDQVTRLMTSIFNPEFSSNENHERLSKQMKKERIKEDEKRIISEKENRFNKNYPLPVGMKWDDYSNPVLKDGLTFEKNKC